MLHSIRVCACARRTENALRVFLAAVFLAVASSASAQTTLTGILNLVWEDPADASPPRLLAFITVEDSTIPLEFGAGLQPDLLRLDRQRVTVTGSAAQAPASPPAFQILGIQGIDIAPGTPPAGSGKLVSGPLLSGSLPWITVLCRFADSTNVTPAQPSYYSSMFTGPGQTLDAYWREVSYSNISLTGSNTVTKWYDLPGPRSRYVSSIAQDLPLAAKDCAGAADADVNFTAYAGINLVFNQSVSANNNFYGGTNTFTLEGITASWRTNWLYGAYSLGILAHETGHGFGFPHSSGPYGQTYDSAWDVMSGTTTVHTISYHKDLDGWIPANRIVTVEGGSSTAITLDVLSAPVTGVLPLMVKIPVGTSLVRFYTIELRRRVGFDNGLPQTAFPASGNAVLIHDVTTARNSASPAFLVDGDHNGNPNDAGANWTVGEVFFDSATGIRVEVTGETSSSVTVVVTNRSQQPPHIFFGTLAGKQGTIGTADGTGSAARFSSPSGMAVDGAGNVYVADQFNYAIRKISPGGAVTTFAGVAGIQGSADGTGDAARFSVPTDVAIDAAGTLYVADNSRIRKISPLRVVSTLAQLPVTVAALTVDAAGTVYAASSAYNVIYKVTSAGAATLLAGLAGSTGSADGVGTAARFNGPNGIAVDKAGVVYVADTSNFTIRKISPAGAVTTFSGTPGVYWTLEDDHGTGFFYGPTGMAMLPDGSFYVADTYHSAIRKVTPSGIVTTIAGLFGIYSAQPGVDGEGEAAHFGQPRGIAVDAGGTIYVSDYYNHTIRVGTRRTLLKSSPSALRFGITRLNGQIVSQTPPQEITVGYEGVIPAWTAVADQAWVQITSGSGTGAGRFVVNVADPGGSVTSATATITLSAPALNVVTTITVVLTIQQAAGSAPAFGAFDTPANNATSLAGAIAVTGWTLDNVGVVKVQLWRNCIEAIDRAAGACAASAPGQPANFVYIGDAAFLAGARPDVEVANLGIPMSYRAGWGYLMSTNALPHLPTVKGAGGQGSFTLSAYAIDVEGQFTLLGTKSISIDNDNATIPFGVLDTPTQGGTITTSPYAAFGWAMTQPGKCIDPTKTTSYKVYIDGLSRTLVPNVNWFAGLTRPDIAAAYPGRCNTDNSMAAYYIDANALGLTNGLHTTGWDVIDDKGNIAGIGSRFFNVLIGSSVTGGAGGAGGTGGAGAAGGLGGTADSVVARRFSVADLDRPVAFGDVRPLQLFAPAVRDVRLQVGGDEAPFTTLTPGTAGQYAVRFGAGGRMALDLGGPVDAGYQIVGDELRALPAGSTLDAAAGTFAWQPPVPFLGPFNLVFIGGHTRTDVVATIVDPTMSAAVTMHIDTPANESTVSGGFVVAGWALDPLATSGTGIDTLHVWAYRRDGMAAPQFLGAAAVGGQRPDIAALHGEQFERAGFTLSATDLAPGVYDLVVYPWSHRTAKFEAAQVTRVTVK